MQLICFQKIVRQCAIEGEKVLSIIVLNLQKQLLKFYKKQEHLTIVNVYFIGFTGSVSERKLAIDNGAYFSINLNARDKSRERM